MDFLRQILGGLMAGEGDALFHFLMFSAVALITLAVGGVVHARGTIRKRVASVGAEPTTRPAGGHSPRLAGLRAAERIGEYANRHFASLDAGKLALLRRRLIQAGFLGPRAVGNFMLARFVGLAVVGTGAHFLLPMALPELAVGTAWLTVGSAAVLGYFLPQIYLSRRIKSRQTEHRVGFPDFMDLMVVCADAGLSMEASLDRVGRELAGPYPSLSSNLYMTILEMRAGRPLGEALDRLGERLGIAEARSFATLLQQSEELGSSLTDTLRVYSDDMRHKRLARAEEKAYSLPAKLSVPLTMCIFPVVMIVTMLPVVIRMRNAGF